MEQSIERYSMEIPTWTMVGYLPIRVQSMSAVCAGEKIFVFGGMTEDNKDTDAVQCFDTRFNTVCVCACKLPTPMRLTSALGMDNRVLVIMPFPLTVLELSDGQITTVHNLELSKRGHTGVVQHGGNIYIIGGTDALGKMAAFLVNEKQPDIQIKSLPFRRWCFGCVKVTVEKARLNKLYSNSECDLLL